VVYVTLQNFAIGESAEDLASAFLKRYFAIGQIRPDPGMDLIGYYRRSNRARPILFQVKNARRFIFKSNILAKWLGSIHEQPVILLLIESLSSKANKYSFRILHDWLLDNPDWALRLDRYKTLSISRDDFVQINDDDKKFSFRRGVRDFTGHPRWVVVVVAASMAWPSHI